jgi:hypothetical protein
MLDEFFDLKNELLGKFNFVGFDNIGIIDYRGFYWALDEDIVLYGEKEQFDQAKEPTYSDEMSAANSSESYTMILIKTAYGEEFRIYDNAKEYKDFAIDYDYGFYDFEP